MFGIKRLQARSNSLYFIDTTSLVFCSDNAKARSYGILIPHIKPSQATATGTAQNSSVKRGRKAFPRRCAGIGKACLPVSDQTFQRASAGRNLDQYWRERGNSDADLFQRRAPIRRQFYVITGVQMVIKIDPGLRVDGFPVGPVRRAVFKCVLRVVKQKHLRIRDESGTWGAFTRCDKNMAHATCDKIVQCKRAYSGLFVRHATVACCRKTLKSFNRLHSAILSHVACFCRIA